MNNCTQDGERYVMVDTARPDSPTGMLVIIVRSHRAAKYPLTGERAHRLGRVLGNNWLVFGRGTWGPWGCDAMVLGKSRR
jgi:hypothetical protein